MDEVIIEHTWTRSEFVRARYRGIRFTWFDLAYLFVSAVVGLVFSFLLLLLACWAAAMLLGYFFQPYVIWHNAIALREPRRTVINDDGFTIDSLSVTQRLPWSRFVRSKETANFYIVYPKQRAQASPFKKHVFASPQDEARFRSLLRKHTNASLKSNESLDGLAPEAGANF